MRWCYQKPMLVLRVFSFELVTPTSTIENHAEFLMAFYIWGKSSNEKSYDLRWEISHLTIQHLSIFELYPFQQPNDEHRHTIKREKEDKKKRTYIIRN